MPVRRCSGCGAALEAGAEVCGYCRCVVRASVGLGMGMADVGGVSRETLVWTAGMSAWEPAEAVAALRALFPPPLPGASN